MGARNEPRPTIVGGFHSRQKHGGFLADVRKGIWSELNAALAKTSDRATRLHLEDARDQITKAFDPKFAPPAPAGPATPPGFPGVDEGAGCWPDYAIRKEPR